jgi:hypothetical protein
MTTETLEKAKQIQSEINELEVIIKFLDQPPTTFDLLIKHQGWGAIVIPDDEKDSIVSYLLTNTSTKIEGLKSQFYSL